jgi:hypothetical protein
MVVNESISSAEFDKKKHASDCNLIWQLASGTSEINMQTTSPSAFILLHQEVLKRRDKHRNRGKCTRHRCVHHSIWLWKGERQSYGTLYIYIRQYNSIVIMISACKTSSARRITAVIPCFPYARQPDSHGKGFSRVPVDQYDKLSTLFESRKIHPSRSIPSTQAPRFTDEPFDLVATDSASSLTEGSSRKLSTFSSPLRLDTSASATSNTVLASQLFPNESGASSETAVQYKHWTARSGTLVADLLVTAGANQVSDV